MTDRQKLDFSRPVLPERCSRQRASEPERNLLPVGNPSAILFDWERNTGWPKHEKKSEGFDSEDGQTDEWDTLSRSISFLENFSVSGWNISDESDADPQARDFMMRRFLRAAKAIASKTPPHSSKKMHAISKEPMHATMAEKGTRPIPAPGCRTNLSSYFLKIDLGEEEYDEENMNDEEDQGHISGQRCRLLPISCLLDRFPGQRKLPLRRAKAVRRLQAKCVRSPSKGNKGLKSTEIMPIPQPPSDSWLHRALPSISSGNHLMQSYHGSSSSMQKHCKKQAPEQKRVHPKRKTMVKTSILHPGHLLYSKEMLAPISELETY